MAIPTMPRVLYAQMWRSIRPSDGERDWHPLHPHGSDDVPTVHRALPTPERADPRYEVIVVRYVLDDE
jgi:hypothetical protein